MKNTIEFLVAGFALLLGLAGMAFIMAGALAFPLAGAGLVSWAEAGSRLLGGIVALVVAYAILNTGRKAAQRRRENYRRW